MKTLKQLLEDIQTGYAPNEISYKGYTTKNLHHVPDATKAFQATITRVEKGTLEDTGEVLDALKNTDTYMKLNDMHLEQEKDLDPSELQQWLKSHEAAKQALTKIGEFEHHYDYWNSHNAELQYLKANQTMPQETESVQESVAGARPTRDELASRFQFTFNRTPAGKAREVARNREELKQKIKAKKASGGLAGPKKGQLPEEVEGVAEGSTGWHPSSTVKNPNFNDELSGRRVSPPGRRLKSGGLDYNERTSQERTKALMKHTKNKGGLSGPKGPLPEEVELEEAKTQNPYHAGYAAHGEKKTRQHNPYKEGSEGAAMWAKGWEHASDGKPKAKFTNENFGADFLAMARQKNPNARLVTPEQKKKEAEELAKKRADLKPAHAAPTGNPRPLGGYDPKSNRSYSESVELEEAVKKKLVLGSKVSHPVHGKGIVVSHSLGGGTMGTVVKFADGKKVRVDHKKLKTEEVETIEEGPYSSGQLKPSKEMEDQEKKVVTSRTSTIRGRDSKGVYTATMKDGKEVSKVYEEESINELSKTTLGSYIKKRSHDVATMGAVTRQHANDSEAARKDQDYSQARKSAEKADNAFMKGWKYRERIGKAVDRLTKEEVELDEAVTVSHARYQRSHSKNATGSGNWMFTHKPMGNVDYKNSSEVHSARGLFSDAKKSAQKWAKEHGHRTVYVMESVDLDEKTLTPAELKKREEIAKAIERKNPNMDKARKMAIATAVAKRVVENKKQPTIHVSDDIIHVKDHKGETVARFPHTPKGLDYAKQFVKQNKHLGEEA